MQIKRVKTYTQKQREIKRAWRLLDADHQVLGALASQIAFILQGKDKKTYTPHLDGGDYIVLINASQIVVTGTKAAQKTYIKHSNYPGGLVKENFSTLQKRRPDAIIRQAVKGMLPDNRLRDARLSRLKIFAGSKHTYTNYFKTSQTKK
jgi:large subunit ribosomal protein L13